MEMKYTYTGSIPKMLLTICSFNKINSNEIICKMRKIVEINLLILSNCLKIFHNNSKGR